MSSWRPFVETVHLVSVGIWLGALLMAGAAAAILFPTIRDLDPTLPAFAAYDGEHWRIAGGHVGEKIFLVLDVVGFVCVMLAIITLSALVRFLGVDRGRVSSYLRGVGLLAAFIAFAWGLFMVTPKMNRASRQYWEAARAGDQAVALEHKTAFDELHPRASQLLTTTAIALGVTFIAGVWSAAAYGGARREQPEPPGDGLERPALAGRGS